MNGDSRRAVLFRFHKDLFVSRNRLRLLKRFDPDVPVYGLFGGSELLGRKFQRSIRRVVGDSLEHVYVLRGRDKLWKWAHSDLAAAAWFRDVGHEAAFDVLHVFEWDLLIVDRLADAYRSVPADAVGLTGLVPLERVETQWSWLAHERSCREWIELKEWVDRRFGRLPSQYACVATAACLPRGLLAEYVDVQPPALAHDELRLPLVAGALGFELRDTGFMPDWFDADARRFFNASAEQIETATVTTELGNPLGRRVFHPYRRPFPVALLSGRRSDHLPDALEGAGSATVRLGRAAAAAAARR